MTHVLPGLLDVTPDPSGEHFFTGPAAGPPDKRAYGGHLAAQALAAACRTLNPGLAPTSLHVQFLRGGEAGAPVSYQV
jgi:acyl-CoA thioesterase II